MGSTSNWIWAAGLTLQCLLLAVLARRGVVRRLPVFTSLIALYLLRSLFLFAAFGRLSAATYQSTYAALSWLDILLQIVVAWELFRGGWRNLPSAETLWRRVAIFAGLAALSAAAAWAISRAVPTDLRAPIDRGVLFPSLLFVTVAIAAILRHDPPAGSAPRRILEGFAPLGMVAILSQIGRTLAALHRDGTSYKHWSYAAAVSYLVVLVFWLLAVPAEKPAAPVKPARKRGIRAA